LRNEFDFNRRASGIAAGIVKNRLRIGQMKEKTRLIVPVWGEMYANRLASIMLPALLAPGNVPALSESFAVELVIVTESRLFDFIRNSSSFQAVAKFCSVLLVPIDDLLTDIPGDYGVVLTYALFRGFGELGPKMTEVFLIFLNADFVVSDGSLRHLAELMREGKRVIHAPSFRVVAEDVWPKLQARVDGLTCTLNLPSRDMVKLALADKHPTVRARTVNQRLFHQTWMDHYYWYVDENTLIGYQLPIALVAIKPECVVTEPVVVWDYGFLPEAAPTAEPHFIGDSDDFFMIEPQSRDSGADMIRLGWISFDDIARNLSSWTTKQQRECGQQLLTIHAADLPTNIDEVIAESRAYMAEIYRRLSPPVSHIGHPFLGRWFDEAKARRRGTTPRAPIVPDADVSHKSRRSVLRRALRAFYRSTFGAPPQVSKFHPLWTDGRALWKNDASFIRGKQSILRIGPDTWLFCGAIEDTTDASILLSSSGSRSAFKKAPYDACVCTLTQRELPNLGRLYAAIRPLMKDDGQVLFHAMRTSGMFEGIGDAVENLDFPDIDISEIHFYGTWATAALRAVYLRACRSLGGHPMLIGLVLVMLAPLVRLANARAARRDPSIFSPLWTSLSVEFAVKRVRPAQLRHSEDQPQAVRAAAS
jgi:hypothetical protein